MDIGLNVEFDGKRNIVMEGGIVKEYPIGGLICDYARLHPTELKPLIMNNPFFQDMDLRENGGEALMSLYETMKEKYGVVTAVMVLTDISDIMADFNRANDEELQKLLATLNEDKDINKIKEFILGDTGFNEFGITTIGQALLSSYAAYANSYVVFKHTFNMLVTENEYDEDQVMKFWDLYSSHVEFQHIDFQIMFFNNAFHSIYTIKSSLSLVLFEAAHALETNTKFIKCKNCGNYFVPVGRSDSKYCGYPSPQDASKNCRDIGANATQAKKMKNDALTQEYRRLYMRLKMALKRHPEDQELASRLKELTDGMKERRKLLKTGGIYPDDVLEWISSFDSKLENK